jgi:ribonuclease HI
MIETRMSLVFDGGSLGNPGKGYGSYRLTVDGTHFEIDELDFGDNVTSNQADYRTLIAGLREALAVLESSGNAPRNAGIDVVTDSKLVVEQLHGRWKVRHDGLKPLHAEARELLRQFSEKTLAWQPRAKTVKVLGH